MKIIRLTPLFVFFFCMALGTIIGANLNPFQSNLKTHHITTLANDQRTVLLIFVNRLEEDALLIGVWTLIYGDDFRNPIWIPIYPALPSVDPKRADELAKTFQLDNNIQPDPAFFALLRERNLAWSGYIILDGEAAITTMRFFNVPSRPISSTEWLSIVSIKKQDPQIALANQTALIQSICNSAAVHSSDYNLLYLYKYIGKHVHSDLDLSQAFSEWRQFLRPGKPLTCRFPSLIDENSKKAYP